MLPVLQRFGLQLSRGAALLLLVFGTVIGAAFWIGPFRPLPAELKLVVLGGDGRFRDNVDMPGSWADSSPPQPDVPARFPLVLAVHNQGARAAHPIRLALSVPVRFRIANTAGAQYNGGVAAGNPLARYVFAIDPGRVPPGQIPKVLSSLDTLWLEPVVPSYYCSVIDSVPEFFPAPPQDPRALSQVRIFYSFDARTRSRQTGLLTLKLEPELLARAPAPTPPVFPTRTVLPEYPRPVTGPLRFAGSRVTHCGDPGNAIELQDVVWETAEGGRFFVLYYGGLPRKYLLDLNRDSIIEMEIWDPNGDGKFETGRSARMVIPEFLMPPVATVQPIDTAALLDSLRVDASRADSVVRTLPVPRLDYQFSPDVFGDTGAGPLRFWRELQRARGQPIDSAAARPDTVPARVPPATRPVTPRPPAQQPPVRRDTTPVQRDTIPGLLGRPVRDTTRRDTIRTDTIRRDTLNNH